MAENFAPITFALVTIAPIFAIIVLSLYLKYLRPDKMEEIERFKETDEGKSELAGIEQSLNQGIKAGIITGVLTAGAILVLGRWLSSFPDMILLSIVFAIGIILYLLVVHLFRVIGALRGT